METRSEVPDEMVAILRQHPGMSTRALARAAGVDESTADYHLRRLRRAGRALAQPWGRELCWFPAGAGFCPVLRRAIPALRREEVARVALALDEAPATAGQLADRAGVPVGAARWATVVLEDAGIAERNATGRVQLRAGAQVCIGRATGGQRCDEWGRCPVSRACAARFEAQAAPPPTPRARL